MLDLDPDYGSSRAQDLNLTIGKVKVKSLFTVNFNQIISTIAKLPEWTLVHLVSSLWMTMEKIIRCLMEISKFP